MQETYGKSSSDSSDDEDWSESADMGTPNRVKKYAKREESARLSKANFRTIRNHKNSKTVVGMSTEVDTVRKSDSDHSQVSQVGHEISPDKTHQALGTSPVEHEVSERHRGHQEPESSGNKSSASVYRRLGEIAKQVKFEYVRFFFNFSSSSSSNPLLIKFGSAMEHDQSKESSIKNRLSSYGQMST